MSPEDFPRSFCESGLEKVYSSGVIVVFGLTISSSWGNGHATLWRGLCRATFFSASLNRCSQVEFDPEKVSYEELVDKFGGDSLPEMKARYELYLSMARER